MASSPDTPRKYFRKEIQGFRALAVFLVILYHARFSIPFTLEFKGGFVGVDVFFVISGFVVGGVILRKLEEFSARTFLLRRAQRLWPALAIVTTFTLVGSFFLIGVDRIGQVSQTGIWSTLWTSNLYLLSDSAKYFESDTRFNPLLHTWSLSVEEQFYLLITVLVLASTRLARKLGHNPRRILTPIIVVLFFASLFHSQAAVQSSPALAFFLPSTRAWEFLAGLLLYIFAGQLQRANWAWLFGLPAAAAGISMIGYAAVFYDDRTLFPGISAGLPVTGALLLIVAGLTDKSGLVQAVFGNGVMRFFGDISYGWYLWHWPLIVFADLIWAGNDEIALAVSVVAILPAWLSNKYLESVRSFGSRREKHAFAQPKLIAAIVFPTAMGVSLLGLEHVAFGMLKTEGSFLSTVRENRDFIEAETRVPTNFSAAPDILVIGDSHAVVIAKALASYPDLGGLTVGSATEFKGCLFMAEPFPGRSSDICEEWQSRTLDEIQKSPARIVVLHGYTTGRATGIKRGTTAPIEILSDGGAHLDTAADALDAYEIGLTNWIGGITSSGKQVFLVTSIPDFSLPLPYDLPENRTTTFSVLAKINPHLSYESVQIVPLNEALNRNSALLDRETAVVQKFQMATVIDLSPLICSAEDCRQWRDGRLVYIDLDHLASNFASEEIAPFLARQLGK